MPTDTFHQCSVQIYAAIRSGKVQSLSQSDTIMKLGLWFMLSLYCMCRAEPVQLPGIQTTEKFEQSSILDKDGKYILFWNFNDTHVTFEVHVKTRGYVGFGISGNGDMFPGDVVVGWVKNGVTHFAVG